MKRLVRLKKTLKGLVKWIFPYNVISFLQDNYVFIDLVLKNPKNVIAYFNLMNNNKEYKNIYHDKRCFIMCTGPSINKQDLSKLKNDIVFGVSTGYLHKQYSEVHPKYHIMPQITYSEKFGTNEAEELFKEIDANTSKDTEFFFSITDCDFIKRLKLFKGKKVNYVAFSGDMKNSFRFNITKTVPGVQSVPIMGIILAMYMGFKEIYLLGCDHDSVVTNKYVHAFTVKDTDPACDKDGIIIDKTDTYISIGRLFEQYRIILGEANKRNVRIFNVTDGGELEVFPRKDFNELFNK